MAKKTTTASKTLNRDELTAEIIRLQTELAEAKRSHAARELTNTGRLSELRQSIARAKTAFAALNIGTKNPSTQLGVKEKKS